MIELVEVEATVEGLLGKVPEYVWNGEKLPVPVDEIVSNVYGLQVRLVDDMTTAPGCPEVPSDSISGLLLTGLGEIWVNGSEARKWEGRRRFTVGHELGHYVMHQESKPRVFCRTDVIDENSDTPPPVKPPMEIQADAFAAAMLMPEHLVREQARLLGGDIDQMKLAFGCSHKAMFKRMKAFGLT